MAANEAVSSELNAARDLLKQQMDAERARLRAESEAQQSILELRNELAFAQSRCAQREEQLAQLEAQRAVEGIELEQSRVAVVEAQAEIARLAERLAETDAWVFRLAGEREAAFADARSLQLSLAQQTQNAAKELANARSEHERDLADVVARVAAAEQEREVALADNRRLDQQLVETREDRDAQGRELYAELAILTRMLQVSDAKTVALSRAAEVAQSSADEISATANQQMEQSAELAEMAIMSGRIVNSLARLPRWWTFAPKSARKRWEQERLRRLGLFDASIYLAANPDVATANVCPIRHYLEFGLQERRRGVR
jgi:hypothetical protein